MDEAQGKMEEDIYNSLKEIEDEERVGLINKAFITDFLSQKLWKLGYRKPLDRPGLEEEIDKAVKGRLISIESLAWNQQCDWSQRDRIIREHLEYIRKDLLALIVPKDNQHEQRGARANFLRLPIEERRKILAIQAQNLADSIADSQAKEDSKMMD